MDLSIKLSMLLPFVLTCLAAPATPQRDTAKDTVPAVTAATASNNNMFGNLALPLGQPIKSVTELKKALTASVKSQLMTSFANMSPEQVTTFTGAANPNELSQFNLMGGINSLVSVIVQQLLQSLLPRILGQNSAPTTNVDTGMGFPMAGGFTPQQPVGGMFGSMGSMFPMNMMLPSMMFGFMDSMF